MRGRKRFQPRFAGVFEQLLHRSAVVIRSQSNSSAAASAAPGFASARCPSRDGDWTTSRPSSRTRRSFHQRCPVRCRISPTGGCVFTYSPGVVNVDEIEIANALDQSVESREPPPGAC